MLLTLLFAFLLYPNRVYLNRGNHEDLSLNLSRHFNPNFKKDTELKFNKYGSNFFNQSQRLFRRLPLATIVENNAGFRCFITHGGLSNRLDLNFISSPQLNRFAFASITIKNDDEPAKRKMAEQLSDLLWSDPMTTGSKMGCNPNNQRGIGWLFGEDVSNEFCRKNGFNCVVRSHECRDTGITQDHPHCFTIFTSSNYCSGTNQAAVLVLNANESRLAHHRFTTVPFTQNDYTQQKDFLISSFKSFLNKESNSLLSKFYQIDRFRSNWLNVSEWASILSQHVLEKYGYRIDPIHFITLKDYICPCDDKNNTANYSSMFKNPNANQEEFEVLEFLESLFQIIDSDGNGYISKQEGDEAIRFMNKTLGTAYNSSFLNEIDQNKDGVLSINEFKIGFCKAFNLGERF